MASCLNCIRRRPNGSDNSRRRVPTYRSIRSAPPPFFVRSDADDRTLDVDADFSYLTVPLLRRIQTEFLRSYPLWRVILVGEQPSCSIAIYPSAIRFGNRPVGVNPDEALRELIPTVLALRGAKRPRREHLARCSGCFPCAVRAIGEQPFLICGVLDNYEGDYSRLTICLLIRGADREAVRVKRPPGRPTDFLWRDSEFGIDANGVITSYIDVPETAPFCLVPWLPPADYRGPLPLIEQATGRRHTYELKSENIIRTTPER